MIVEDHGVVAEGLAALINHQDDMKVVGQPDRSPRRSPRRRSWDPT